MDAWRSLSLFYLDASIGFEALLPAGDPRARRWLTRITKKGDTLTSSALLELEIIRALRREGIAPSLAGPLLDRVSLVSVDDVVLRLAGAIERHVKSLDAIHLATCSLLGSGVAMVTHDRAMAEAAAELGLDCFDPLA